MNAIGNESGRAVASEAKEGREFGFCFNVKAVAAKTSCVERVALLDVGN